MRERAYLVDLAVPHSFVVRRPCLHDARDALADDNLGNLARGLVEHVVEVVLRDVAVRRIVEGRAKFIYLIAPISLQKHRRERDELPEHSTSHQRALRSGFAYVRESGRR